MRFDGSSFVEFDLFNPTKQQVQHGPQSKGTPMSVYSTRAGLEQAYMSQGANPAA